MKYNILAKSSLKKADLLNKKQCGAQKIEIQLLKNFINENMNCQSYIDILDGLGLEITAVHTPITCSVDIQVERLVDNKNKEIFFKTCSLAQKFSEHFHNNILVIMHINWSFNDFLKFSNVFEEVNSVINEALQQFKDIEIGIENVIPIQKSKGTIITRNGYLFDNVEFVNYFRNKYKTDRVGTVLDTCHAITTLRFMNVLYKNGVELQNELKLEDYFKKNKDTIKLIHLANVKDLGMKVNTHGTPFKDEKEDIRILKDIFKFYNIYEYKCPITIEVFEYDYENCLNYSETVKNIEKYIKY